MRRQKEYTAAEFGQMMADEKPHSLKAFECAFAITTYVGATESQISDEVRFGVRAMVVEFYPAAEKLQQIGVSTEAAKLIIQHGYISSCMVWDLAHFISHMFDPEEPDPNTRH